MSKSSNLTGKLRMGLRNTALAGLMTGVLIIPFSALAATTPPAAAATVNFAGVVTAVNAGTNTLTATVNWLFGVAAVTTSNGQTAVLPVAAHFCSGKSVTVTIPATVKLISFSGKTITLSQVPTGAYFVGTANYASNGTLTETKAIRFTTSVPTPPKVPAGWNVPKGKTLTNAPQGSGVANVAGKVTAINTSSNSVSLLVNWFYGSATGASNSQTVAIAGHFCPNSSVTVTVPASAKLISFSGKTITLSQVPSGAYFNGTIGWSGGVYTAQTLRFTTSAPKKPTGGQ
ncbi:MAG: hypothetical protein HY220_01125 [Candidatus Sungbacteria bacterium]|uniref:Uncharacterized protein n=1 Tax=Candidatus Sungiibacteriota bacterium TaxID=2750080 RepID=A0A9D6QTV9_9BACT|nr:hypothetical protein [Candidatus Sungbacteria bacterium]